MQEFVLIKIATVVKTQGYQNHAGYTHWLRPLCFVLAFAIMCSNMDTLLQALGETQITAFEHVCPCQFRLSFALATALATAVPLVVALVSRLGG